MSTVASTETDRLMRAIAALSGVPNEITPAGRILSDEGGSSPLDLLLSEVNETVLRRRLVFSSVSAGSISLEVSEKRILRLFSDASGVVGQGGQQLNLELTPKDGKKAITILRTFCENATSLHVVSTPVRNTDDTAFEGVSCADLLRSAQESTLEAENAAIIAAIESCRTFADAVMLFSDGKLSAEYGEARHFAALTTLAQSIDPKNEPTGVRIWQSGCKNSEFVACFHDKDCSVFLIAPGMHLDECIRIWQSAMSS